MVKYVVPMRHISYNAFYKNPDEPFNIMNKKYLSRVQTLGEGEAPEILLHIKEELLELLKEAISAFGFAGRRDCVSKIDFEYIASPWFIREVKK